MRPLNIPGLVLGLLISWSGDAIGQQAPACVKRVDLVEHLRSKYGERPESYGVADNGAMVELFTSSDGSTWTLAMTLPSGVSCLVATGSAWDRSPKAPGQGL
jgi:hypothetical protein